MTHVITPLAKDDIIRQFRYYLFADAPEVAARFLDAVDESVERICRMPEIGAAKQSSNKSLAGLRSWPVKGFDNIWIYYAVRKDVLRIIRVLDGRRNVKRILKKEID